MIQVVDSNPEWPSHFLRIAQFIRPAVGDSTASIEHVGSTSVPGLAAKPVIDISVIVPDPHASRRAIEGLVGIGYRHFGDLGISGREALRAERGEVAALPRHNLYVCLADGAGIRNHLAVRDRLRRDPAAVAAYGALKRALAVEHADDVDGYTQAKSDFLSRILLEEGLGEELVERIRGENTTGETDG